MIYNDAYSKSSRCASSYTEAQASASCMRSIQPVPTAEPAMRQRHVASAMAEARNLKPSHSKMRIFYAYLPFMQ